MKNSGAKCPKCNGTNTSSNGTIDALGREFWTCHDCVERNRIEVEKMKIETKLMLEKLDDNNPDDAFKRFELENNLEQTALTSGPATGACSFFIIHKNKGDEALKKTLSKFEELKKQIKVSPVPGLTYKFLNDNGFLQKKSEEISSNPFQNTTKKENTMDLDKTRKLSQEGQGDMVNCPKCKKLVWKNAIECPGCKCNVKEELDKLKKLEEKKIRLERVCPVCKNIPSRTTYYEETFYYIQGEKYRLSGYNEVTLLRCNNCGWEEKITGDSYEFLHEGADVNRPGTKEHKIYQKKYCPDCGKQTIDGGQCSQCLESRRNNWSSAWGY
jgi:hypothetical protein